LEKPTLPADDPLSRPGIRDTAERYAACLSEVERDANAAYEKAMAWAHEANRREAHLCAAMADIERGFPERGARSLERVSTIVDAEPEARADSLAKAGNAWMIARRGLEALAAFDKALSLVTPDPDLLIDRARAQALLERWRASEEDLNKALDLRPGDALALRLRATTRMKLGVFDLALKDAEDAVRLEPQNVENRLVRGQAENAKRTGKAPE
jgi:tetratricopeptide (TPR) repeat protein